MPTSTISARCLAQPASTDPGQHFTYVLFDGLTIHYTLRSVKFSCSTLLAIEAKATNASFS